VGEKPKLRAAPLSWKFGSRGPVVFTGVPEKARAALQQTADDPAGRPPGELDFAAADPVVALDHKRAVADVGEARGGAKATGSGADHESVVAKRVRRPLLPRQPGLGESPGLNTPTRA
jgi:hypothetical protein